MATTRLVEPQAVHQDIGVIEEPDHHEYFGDLGLGVAELLHGSRVELQSGGAIIQGGDDHGNNFFDQLCYPAPFHNCFILLPVGLQVVGIVGGSAKIHGHDGGAEYRLDLLVDVAYAPCGSAFRYEPDGRHIRLLSLEANFHGTVSH